MTGFSAVVDAGILISTQIPHPLRQHCRSLLIDHLDTCELFAPTLWAYEVTSALTKVVYFNALTLEEAQFARSQIFNYGVQLILPDDALSQLAFEWARRLNRVAAYDSFYLALAQTFDCEFWTADKRLCNAVNEAWVRWVGDFTKNI